MPRSGTMRPAIPLRVNRAPVLALWVAVVAERLGHAPATALSLAAVQAGIAPEPPRDLPHGQ
ncbi:MAG: hypothetical protein K2X46_00490, partial [Roseomonas sp.]|nr:hypothetical protein [Roseomonas sp.]